MHKTNALSLTDLPVYFDLLVDRDPEPAVLPAAALPAPLCLAAADDDLKMLPCMLPPPLLRSLPTLPLLLPGTRRDSCLFKLASPATEPSPLPLEELSDLDKGLLGPGIRELCTVGPAPALVGEVLLAAAACSRLLKTAISGPEGLPPAVSLLVGVDAPEVVADKEGDFGDDAYPLLKGILLVGEVLLPIWMGAGALRPNAARPPGDAGCVLAGFANAAGILLAGAGLLGEDAVLEVRVNVATRGSGVGRNQLLGDADTAVEAPSVATGCLAFGCS